MLRTLRLRQTFGVTRNSTKFLLHTATTLNSDTGNSQKKQLSKDKGKMQWNEPTRDPELESGPKNSTLERIKKELAEDKAKLQWRTPISELPDEWQSKFKYFENSDQTGDYIVMMQQPLDLSVKGIKKYFTKRREKTESFMQQYIAERHELLGPELAAAHFILFRGGAVKFSKDSNWMQPNEDGEFNLPPEYHPDYKVEALRCDNMNLYYEGLENIRCLQHIKFLSFHNVERFDDWCLDRVSGAQYSTLEILDISGTKCTYNGLSCLYRIPSLQLLILDDPKKSVQFELTCSMLEEAIPNLKVIAASEMHPETKS